ncbi:hypothetical protein [Salinarimonas rosea]|uniref:hypothetical protein n=1 Tax=Salinarimonas rosea TaxID=552063 RepID=UPI0004231D28|nr:hypothetical protein [Salinarimonas rosea]
MGNNDRGAWLGGLRRYLAVLALASLAWEIGHTPLYTIWSEASLGEIAFAIVHCTAGDVLIGLSALAAALVVFGAAGWPGERFGAVAAATIVVGVAYTAFSEWLNIVVREAWAYTDAMPTVPVGGFELGLSPIAQWLVVPALAFAAARRGTAPTRTSATRTSSTRTFTLRRPSPAHRENAS